MSARTSKGMVISVALCEEGGVMICVDNTEVREGGEQICHRVRFAREDPIDALYVVAASLWPRRTFRVEETTEEADDGTPQH